MDELKPCPFCGKGNALDQYPCDFLDGTGANVVRCAWCHGAAPLRNWNRRAASGGDSASLEQRADDLFWALMQAPYADTTIGNIVCAETTPQRLDSAWMPLLTAALANQQGVGGWQPIETAPRDGTRIILGRPDCDGDGGVSVAGYWLEELEDGVDYMGNDGGFTDVDYQVFQPGRSFGAESYRHAGSQPTHWRPMPDPPTQPAGDVGREG